MFGEIRDKDVPICFLMARSWELGAGKPAPRDAERARVELAARLPLSPLP